MPRAKRKSRPTKILVPPTPERIAKADGFFHVTKDGPMTVRDAPFERLHARHKITQQQYDAGVKYRHHWHNGGMQERFAVQNFMGVGGGEGWEYLPATERQVQHRETYRKAVQDLGPILSVVVEEIVCREVDPVIVGRKLWHYADDKQARAAATSALVIGLDRLYRFFY